MAAGEGVVEGGLVDQGVGHGDQEEIEVAMIKKTADHRSFVDASTITFDVAG